MVTEDSVGIVEKWASTFDTRFWPLYPRKIAKQAARRRWALLADPEKSFAYHQALLADIVAGVQRFAAVVEADGTSRRTLEHPSTWINNRRWESRISAPPTTE